MKKILKLLFHRIFLIGFLIFLQASILIFIIIRFSEYFIYFYSFSLVLSMVVVLWILNNRSNPSYKIAWIIPIFLFPIFDSISSIHKYIKNEININTNVIPLVCIKAI